MMAEAAFPMAASVWMGGMFMGKENDASLEFLRANRRFADLFNGGLFAGKCVVDPAELQEAGESYTEYRESYTERRDSYAECRESCTERRDSYTEYREDELSADSGSETGSEKTGSRKARKKGKAGGMQTVSRTRDIKKRLKSGTELRILAVEAQSLTDYTMPWRCMNYDVLEYGRQVSNLQRENDQADKLRRANDHKSIYESDGERLSRFKKEDRLDPVYTICLYHGTEPWDGPRSLRDMMNFGSDMDRELWEEAFSDYGMRLICVNELENVETFSTELRQLFAIMNYRNDKQGMQEFLEKHEEYTCLDEETAQAISAVVGVSTFMKNGEKFKEEGGYNMCQAIREMWTDGVSHGKTEGILIGKTEGVALSAAVCRVVNAGITDNEQIAEQCGCTVEDVEAVRKAFGL